jgi:hypothetical protein
MGTRSVRDLGPSPRLICSQCIVALICTMLILAAIRSFIRPDGAHPSRSVGAAWPAHKRRLSITPHGRTSGQQREFVIRVAGYVMRFMSDC